MIKVRNRKSRRGAVALEYILIAALVAIALISTFIYFRKTMTSSVEAISDTTADTVQSSIDQGTAETNPQEVNSGSASQ